MSPFYHADQADWSDFPWSSPKNSSNSPLVFPWFPLLFSTSQWFPTDFPHENFQPLDPTPFEDTFQVPAWPARPAGKAPRRQRMCTIWTTLRWQRGAPVVVVGSSRHEKYGYGHSNDPDKIVFMCICSINHPILFVFFFDNPILGYVFILGPYPYQGPCNCLIDQGCE